MDQNVQRPGWFLDMKYQINCPTTKKDVWDMDLLSLLLHKVLNISLMP